MLQLPQQGGVVQLDFFMRIDDGTAERSAGTGAEKPLFQENCTAETEGFRCHARRTEINNFPDALRRASVFRPQNLPALDKIFPAPWNIAFCEGQAVVRTFQDRRAQLAPVMRAHVENPQLHGRISPVCIELRRKGQIDGISRLHIQCGRRAGEKGTGERLIPEPYLQTGVLSVLHGVDVLQKDVGKAEYRRRIAASLRLCLPEGSDLIRTEQSRIFNDKISVQRRWGRRMLPIISRESCAEGIDIFLPDGKSRRRRVSAKAFQVGGAGG